MRVISVKTLKNFWKTYPESEHSLKTWYREVKKSEWKNHNDLKKQFRNASVVGAKRVIFNIKGNSYRLIVDIEYYIKLVFVVWVGTHKDYDKINVKKIEYVKSN